MPDEFEKLSGVKLHIVYVTDMQAPTFTQMEEILHLVGQAARACENMIVHCGEGWGRTGMILTALLLLSDVDLPVAKTKTLQMEKYNGYTPVTGVTPQVVSAVNYIRLFDGVRNSEHDRARRPENNLNTDGDSVETEVQVRFLEQVYKYRGTLRWKALDGLFPTYGLSESNEKLPEEVKPWSNNGDLIDSFLAFVKRSHRVSKGVTMVVTKELNKASEINPKTIRYAIANAKRTTRSGNYEPFLALAEEWENTLAEDKTKLFKSFIEFVRGKARVKLGAELLLKQELMRGSRVDTETIQRAVMRLQQKHPKTDFKPFEIFADECSPPPSVSKKTRVFATPLKTGTQTDLE